MSAKQKVSAIIPNYNGLKLLKANLSAVLKCLNNNDELVIVDDDSTDKSVPWLVDKFQLKNQKINTSKGQLKVKIGKYKISDKLIRVVVVPNKKNLRFAKSVNRGVLACKHSLIFLLNNDVSPSTNVLDHLLPYFRNDKVFAVGCREIEKQLGGIEGGKNILKFRRGMFIHSRAKKYDAGPTAWASGGSAMFDKEKWLKLGGFDPLFFPAYWEDIDLSFRARKMGWQVLFDSKALVDHNHESTNQDVFGQQKIDQMSWDNAKKFVMKNGNILQKFCYYLWRPYWWWKVERNSI